MKTVAPSTPYGYTIFCDDVRQEMGGKTSYMGIYKSKLIFNTPLPASLPKFFLVVNYFERPGESTDPVTLHVYMPDDAEGAPTVTAEIPLDDFRSKPPKLETPDSVPLISATVNLVVMPFEMKSEGRLRVRAYRGDLEIRLGTLSIVSRPAEDHPPKEVPIATQKVKRRKRPRSKKST